MLYSIISPGNPRIPDVKIVMGLIPMAMEIPCETKNPLAKKIATVPVTIRKIKLMIHSFFFLKAPINSTKIQAATIIIPPI